MVTSQICILKKKREKKEGKQKHFKQNCLSLKIIKLKGDCIVALTEYREGTSRAC